MPTWRTGSRADGLAGMKATQSATTSAHIMICAPRGTLTQAPHPIGALHAHAMSIVSHVKTHKVSNVSWQGVPDSSTPHPMLHGSAHTHVHICRKTDLTTDNICQLKTACNPYGLNTACRSGMTFSTLCGYTGEQSNGRHAQVQLDHTGRACIGRKPWYAKKKDVQLDAPTYHRMAIVMITTVKAEMVRLACHRRPVRSAVLAAVCRFRRSAAAWCVLPGMPCSPGSEMSLVSLILQGLLRTSGMPSTLYLYIQEDADSLTNSSKVHRPHLQPHQNVSNPERRV